MNVRWLAAALLVLVPASAHSQEAVPTCSLCRGETYYDARTGLVLPQLVTLDDTAIRHGSGARLARPRPGKLVFNFNYASTIDPRAVAGFIAAGERWSRLFNDNITVNVDIEFVPLGAGVLGSTNATLGFAPYAEVREQLALDRTSSDDVQAVSALQPGPTFNMLLNGTSTNPNGVGSRTPYVDDDGDDNNLFVRLTTANAKAIGLEVTNPSDARVRFNSTFPFDFDPSNGIGPSSYDFVGVAAHELGHVLGFISGVDILDLNSPSSFGFFSPDESFLLYMPDLFRYTTTSATFGLPNFSLGTYAADFMPPVLSTDRVDHFLSINNGFSRSVSFSTGRNFGDRQQASHWRDNLGIGIMDPTFSTGERGIIRGNDIRLFDLIGYNLRRPDLIGYN